jgi:hypothetical protein
LIEIYLIEAGIFCSIAAIIREPAIIKIIIRSPKKGISGSVIGLPSSIEMGPTMYRYPNCPPMMSSILPIINP